MICAGIDSGSRKIKLVLVDLDTMIVVGRGIADQGPGQEDRAMKLLHDVLNEHGLVQSDVVDITGTGYGRHALKAANAKVTEITCHALGVHLLVPTARVIIDIGGQDSKIIRLSADGFVRDFVMNDRCAAGTGRFLEVVADRLDIDLFRFGEEGLAAATPCVISSTCVVFAETEIIGLLANNESRDNIASGVQRAVASRISSMAGSMIDGPAVLTGGVALIPGMAEILSSVLRHPVVVAPNPQFTGALGAALNAAARHTTHQPQLIADTISHKSQSLPGINISQGETR